MAVSTPTDDALRRSHFRRPGARADAHRQARVAKVTSRRGGGAGLSPEERRALLARSPLFAALDDTELDAVLSFAGTRRVRKHQEIFHRGDPGNQLYALLSGRVKITNTSPDGKGIVYGFLDAGDVFGEIAFFDGRDRTASVVAVRPSELLAIHRRDFLPFLKTQPELSLKLLASLAERLRATDRALEDRTFLSLPSRLAKQLLELARCYGHAEADGLRIQFELSQTELGEMVGISRESVNKQLRGWEEDGLLELDHGSITLRDRAALEAIAGFVLA